MSVTFLPVGLLKHYVKGASRLIVEGKEGQTLEAVAKEIGLPLNPISVFLVNGDPKTKDHLLQPHDEIGLIALVGGG
jgi:sulfur carrier protein ThiS